MATARANTQDRGERRQRKAAAARRTRRTICVPRLAFPEKDPRTSLPLLRLERDTVQSGSQELSRRSTRHGPPGRRRQGQRVLRGWGRGAFLTPPALITLRIPGCFRGSQPRNPRHCSCLRRSRISRPACHHRRACSPSRTSSRATQPWSPPVSTMTLSTTARARAPSIPEWVCIPSCVRARPLALSSHSPPVKAPRVSWDRPGRSPHIDTQCAVQWRASVRRKVKESADRSHAFPCSVLCSCVWAGDHQHLGLPGRILHAARSLYPGALDGVITTQDALKV